MVHIADEVNYDFKLLKSVIETNDLQRLRMIEKVENVFGKDLSGKTIAVLGLAFKPNTDDMRYAPALTIIPELVRKGAKVKGFDPIAISEAKKELGDQLEYSTDLYEVLKGSDLCLVLTEWKEVLEMDVEKVKQLLKQPIIIDGRNCFELEEMKSYNIQYISIGRQEVPKQLVNV